MVRVQQVVATQVNRVKGAENWEGGGDDDDNNNNNNNKY
jgi:hypothetical protein